jgi:hypothetical protein
MINVSTTAASKINELLAEEDKAGSGLRVFVQGGGCSGFQYGLMIEEAAASAIRCSSRTACGCSSTRQHQLSEGRRGRFRRYGHRRRLHDQEPERVVDVRLRPVRSAL